MASRRLASNAATMAAKKSMLNSKLRRICRKECETLEKDLCRKEYAIAKRHPEIGRQLPLIECADLPHEGTPEDADCMSIGLSTRIDVRESKYIDIDYIFSFLIFSIFTNF